MAHIFRVFGPGRREIFYVCLVEDGKATSPHVEFPTVERAIEYACTL